MHLWVILKKAALFFTAATIYSHLWFGYKPLYQYNAATFLPLMAYFDTQPATYKG